MTGLNYKQAENMMLVKWLLDVNVNLGVASKHFCHLVIYSDQCSQIPCLTSTLSGGQVMISGAINFQLDTEPNTDPPVFTLTCTSTGGPATTVSWTRDSNAVTANNDHIITSRVTDTETAFYVHTLRVTGRQEGSYSCSVSNSRTSPAAVSTLQVAGKESEISHDLSCIVPSAAALYAKYQILNCQMIPFQKSDWLKVIGFCHRALILSDVYSIYFQPMYVITVRPEEFYHMHSALNSWLLMVTHIDL